MNTRPDTDQYRELFLNDIPMMDVRAPVEFRKAALGFGQFAELAVHGLDGIGGVNRRAHVIRIFEVSGQG